jgi:hypothetical protein
LELDRERSKGSPIGGPMTDAVEVLSSYLQWLHRRGGAAEFVEIMEKLYREPKVVEALRKTGFPAGKRRLRLLKAWEKVSGDSSFLRYLRLLAMRNPKAAVEVVANLARHYRDPAVVAQLQSSGFDADARLARLLFAFLLSGGAFRIKASPRAPRMDA